MTVSTITITNAINAFISVETMEKRAEKHVDNAYVFCHINETLYLPEDTQEIEIVASNGRRSYVTVSDEALQELEQCHDCDVYARSDDGQMMFVQNHTICQSCYEDNYFHCDSCYTDYHNDNYGTDGQCSECYHDSCKSQFDHVTLTLHDRFTDFKLDHNGKPHETTPSRLNYAIGLEIEAYADHEDEDCFRHDEKHFANALTEAVETIWTEQGILHAHRHSVVAYDDDGSLQHRGDISRGSFEAEVIPLRIETIERAWTNPEVLSAYSDLVKKTYDNCGLHISIAARHELPKRVFSRIARLMEALEANADKARQVLGRKPSAYENNACRSIKAVIRTLDDNPEKKGPIAYRSKPEKHIDKYLVNTEHHQEAIQGRFEFRAFRAPMQADLIHRRIQYAVSMVEFSKAPLAGFYSMTYDEMIDSFLTFHDARMSAK